MSNTNIVVITGNLGNEVDLRILPTTGNPVAEFAIAANKQRFNKQTSQFDTYTTWVTVKMYGKLAESAADRLTKGEKVTITGELAEDTWFDEATQKQRRKLYIVGTFFESMSNGTKATQHTSSVSPGSQVVQQQSSKEAQITQIKQSLRENQVRHDQHNQQNQRAAQQEAKSSSRTQPIAATTRPAGY